MFEHSMCLLIYFYLFIHLLLQQKKNMNFPIILTGSLIFQGKQFP